VGRSHVAGRVALVTGAAVGLGRAFAGALARAGASVSLCDIRPEGREVAERLAAEHGVATAWFPADVASPDDVWRVVDGTVAQLGGIDILVANAGVWRASKATDPLEGSERTYHEVLDVNTRAPFLFGRAVLDSMVERGGGDIVLVSSDHVYTEPARPTGGGPAMDLYDASKWALNGLTIGWARALAPHRIRVNALCMGATDSEMLRGFHGGDPAPEVVATWMTSDAVAGVLVDLIDEGPDGRTGTNVPLWVGDRPTRLLPASDDWAVRTGPMTAVLD
jgi:NAD(P)-dependent dehydrogenase (short-subunit alcohol dehydrogenase family)